MTAADRETGLVEAFVVLTDSLKPGLDVIDTMDVLVHVSTEFTAAVDAAIVLADTRGVLHVMASTSERTSEVEEAQLGTSEGPCLESFHSGRVVEITDLADETQRWPTFIRIAEDRGFKADHGFPLTLRGQTLGVLNLFSNEAAPLSNRDAALAQAMASVATISIVQKQTISRQVQINEQLQTALESRVLIEQAKGVLSQQHGVPIDHAFTMLRNYARSRGAKLHDTAEQIVNLNLTL